MSSTGTVIVALRYRDGVLIGADSQASDPAPPGVEQIGVRWSVAKLRQIGRSPSVTGFAGSMGTAERVLDTLCATKLYARQLADKASVQKALEKDLIPEVHAALNRYYTGQGDKPLVGLSAMWIGAEPLILEHEWSGDSCWHHHFQAAGSGKQTAYAIYSALGGSRLSVVGFDKAMMALMRILITTINLDRLGVAEPIHVWNVTAEGAVELGRVEVDHQLQTATAWMRQQADAFIGDDEAAADPRRGTGAA